VPPSRALSQVPGVACYTASTWLCKVGEMSSVADLSRAGRSRAAALRRARSVMHQISPKTPSPLVRLPLTGARSPQPPCTRVAAVSCACLTFQMQRTWRGTSSSSMLCTAFPCHVVLKSPDKARKAAAQTWSLISLPCHHVIVRSFPDALLHASAARL